MKTGHKTYTTNYTIPILPTFSKVLVKIMYSGFSQNMHCNNILVPEQCGLREDTPTEDAAHKLAVSVLKSINQKMYVG
jgi:hypothetical protein